MYSLWRGGVLLGHLNPELPGDGADALFGMLDPTSAFLPGEAISQRIMLEWPGSPVFHHAENQASARQSVPVEQQLALRDSTNTPVATHTIAIMAMPRATRGMQQRCQEAGVSFSGWCVIVGLVSSERDAH